MLNQFLAGLVITGAVATLVLDAPGQISGRARVIDGDTIDIAGRRVRLWGIDAPERNQPYGREATIKLEQLTRTTVTCTIKDQDKYGRTVARCASSNGDIGQLLVANGLALDYTRYSHGYYKDAEDAARTARIGMWSGPFMSPEKWRAEHKNR